MATPRASIVRGPGYVTWGGQTIVTLDDIVLDAEVSSIPSNVQLFGEVDRILDSVRLSISFTPAALTDALAAVYWPYANPTFGQSLYGAADADCVVQGADGRKITLHGCALIQMPSLTFAAGQPLLGPMAIGCVGKTGEDWSDADKWYTETTQAWSAPALDRATLHRVAYSLQFNDDDDSPWYDLDTEAGIVFEPSLQISDVATDRLGICDGMLESVSCSLRCTPANASLAQHLGALAAHLADATRGASLSEIADAGNLVVSAGVGRPMLTLNHACLMRAPARWGMGKRLGEAQFGCSRTYATGVYGPLFAVAIKPEPAP